MNKHALMAAVLAATACLSSDTAPESMDVTYEECWTVALLEADARCGKLVVPSVYGAPDGPQRRVAFAVKPPRNGEDNGSNPPVVFLMGGPGFAATYYSVVDGYDESEFDFFHEDRDLVLLDYRSLGQSEPFIDCDFSNMEECARILEESGLEPELRAATIARDVDRLIGALGYESAVLYGESWGSQLALTVMRDVPGRISHVVLDGVLSPEVGVRTTAQAGLAGLNHIASACEGSPECVSALGDVRSKIMQLGERWEPREDAAELLQGLATVSHFPRRAAADP